MKVGAAYAEGIAEFLGAVAVYRVIVYRVPYIFELRVVRNSFTRRDFRGIALITQRNKSRQYRTELVLKMRCQIFRQIV